MSHNLEDIYINKTRWILLLSVGCIGVVLFLNLIEALFSLIGVDYGVSALLYLNFIHSLSLIIAITLHTIGIFRFSRIAQDKWIFLFFILPLLAFALISLLAYKMQIYIATITNIDIYVILFLISTFVLFGVIMFCIVKFFRLLHYHTNEKLFRLSFIFFISSFIFNILFIIALFKSLLTMAGIFNFLVLVFAIIGAISYFLGFYQSKSYRISKITLE